MVKRLATKLNDIKSQVLTPRAQKIQSKIQGSPKFQLHSIRAIVRVHGVGKTLRWGLSWKNKKEGFILEKTHFWKPFQK